MDVKKIIDIIRDQQEDTNRIFHEENIIQREILTPWQHIIDNPILKVITGIRRSGKSIFAFQLLTDKKYAYINFDDERLIGLKTEDLNTVLEAFYQQHGELTYIFLDEIQNIDGWELFANRLQRQGLNVIITGSNAKLLSKELATHLTGRHLSVEIFPFSFTEFLKLEHFDIGKENEYSTRKKSLLLQKLQEYITYGGFPESLKDKRIAKNYLTTLYTTILTKDVISRYKINYVTTLREISNYLLSNFSTYITYNKIKNIFHLKSPHTSKKYVSFLQESYLFFLVDKFSFKYKEITASPKKIYVIDTGIIKALAYESSENDGRLLENIVAIELLRRKTFSPTIEMYYWKDYQQHEVDFVIKKGQMIVQLIQVTSVSEKNQIEKREVSALRKASDELKCNNLLIITWDYESKESIDGKEITYIPLWKWLLTNTWKV